MKKRRLSGVILTCSMLCSCSSFGHSSVKEWSFTVSENSLSSDVSSSHIHNYVKTIIEPTCVTEGYELYQCEDGDDEYKDNIIPALDHSFTIWELYVEGYNHIGYVSKCDRCGIKKYDLTASEHTFSSCIDAGDSFHEHTCNGCSYAEKQLHDYTLTDNTDTKTLVCGECGKNMTIAVPHVQSISDYSLLCAQKGHDEAERMFKEAEENNEKGVTLYPYSSLINYKEIKDFTLDLVKNCENEKEKVRVIYDWLCENITYYESAKNADVYEVFSLRKAMDTGFVILMHDMLSSCGIMSYYGYGYAALPTENKDLFTISDEKEIHAWIYVYADAEVLICDPCEGRNDKDNYFDISYEELSEKYLALSLSGVNIVPDGYNYLSYSNDVYHGIYRTEDGQIVHYNENGYYKSGSLYCLAHNGYKINYIFSYDMEEYKHSGTNIYGTAFTNGILYKQEDANVPSYWYYSSLSGISNKYSDYIMYIMFERTYYDTYYPFVRSSSFSVSSDKLYYNYGNGYKLYIGSYSA